MAAIRIEADDLSALSGSQTQVAWAQRIREGHRAWLNQGPAYFDSPDPFMDRMLNRLSALESAQDHEVARAAIVAAVRAHFGRTQACYWIDARERDLETIIYTQAHAAFMRYKRAAMIEALRARQAEGTITSGQLARLERLQAAQAEQGT